MVSVAVPVATLVTVTVLSLIVAVAILVLLDTADKAPSLGVVTAKVIVLPGLRVSLLFGMSRAKVGVALLTVMAHVAVPAV